MKKNILITGGAGFVGSNLALYLKEHLKDHKVICFDNLIRKGSEINAQRLKNAAIEFVKGDIRIKPQLEKLKEIDLIIDCSAEPSVLAAYEDPQYTIDTNLIGTLNCLELARRENAAFIFPSTSRVYPIDLIEQMDFEELPSRFDWKKDAASLGFSYEGISHEFPLTGHRSLYGATKLSSEMIALEYFDMFDLKGVITRFSVIAGPWQMGKVDQGLVGFWLACHKYKKPLSYIGYGGTGKQVRDAIHIDDVCDLILYQITHLDKVHAKIYNVGGGRKNSFSLKELSDKVQGLTKNKIEINSVTENRKSDVRIYITDNSLIEKDLGWAPKKGLDDILEDTDKWMEQYSKQLSGVFE